MDEKAKQLLKQEVLRMHAKRRPCKLDFRATRPLTGQCNLTVAYSPSVAAPFMEIHRDADLANGCTAVSNTVAIVSNSTSVFGLGNIGCWLPNR